MRAGVLIMIKYLKKNPKNPNQNKQITPINPPNQNNNKKKKLNKPNSRPPTNQSPTHPLPSAHKIKQEEEGETVYQNKAGLQA